MWNDVVARRLQNKSEIYGVCKHTSRDCMRFCLVAFLGYPKLSHFCRSFADTRWWYKRTTDKSVARCGQDSSFGAPGNCGTGDLSTFDYRLLGIKGWDVETGWRARMRRKRWDAGDVSHGSFGVKLSYRCRETFIKPPAHLLTFRMPTERISVNLLCWQSRQPDRPSAQHILFVVFFFFYNI